MKLFLLMVILIFGAWAAGVRAHPEVLPDYLQLFLQKDLRKVELRNGREMTGEFMAEKDGRLELMVRGQLMTFSTSEVTKTRQIGPVEIIQALKEGSLLRPKGVSLVEFRREEGLFSGGKRFEIRPQV